MMGVVGCSPPSRFVKKKTTPMGGTWIALEVFKSNSRKTTQNLKPLVGLEVESWL